MAPQFGDRWSATLEGGLLRVGDNVECFVGGVDADGEPAEETLLAKKLEVERPWLAERHGCLPAELGELERRRHGPGSDRGAADPDRLFCCAGEVDTSQVSDPGAEPIVERAGVDQAQARHGVLQTQGWRPRGLGAPRRRTGREDARSGISLRDATRVHARIERDPEHDSTWDIVGSELSDNLSRGVGHRDDPPVEAAHITAAEGSEQLSGVMTGSFHFGWRFRLGQVDNLLHANQYGRSKAPGGAQPPATKATTT